MPSETDFLTAGVLILRHVRTAIPQGFEKSQFLSGITSLTK